jgi:hypothetical protein
VSRKFLGTMRRQSSNAALYVCNGNHLVSGRIEKAKWPGLSLPTWKGHSALREMTSQPDSPREACHFRVITSTLRQCSHGSKYKISIGVIRKSGLRGMRAKLHFFVSVEISSHVR